MTGSVRESVTRGGIDAAVKIFSLQESSTFLPITKNITHPHYTKIYFSIDNPTKNVVYYNCR
jgi:hypothetical protein